MKHVGLDLNSPTLTLSNTWLDTLQTINIKLVHACKELLVINRGTNRNTKIQIKMQKESICCLHKIRVEHTHTQIQIQIQIQSTCCIHQTHAAQQQLPKNITSTTPPATFYIYVCMWYVICDICMHVICVTKNGHIWQWYPTQDDGKSHVIHGRLFSEVTLEVSYTRVMPWLTCIKVVSVFWNHIFWNHLFWRLVEFALALVRELFCLSTKLSLIHISEPTRPY